jgi:hypothetical protein
MISKLVIYLLGVVSIFPTIGFTAENKDTSQKTAIIYPDTPSPTRFVVKGDQLIDLKKKSPVFFRGIGYSPYLANETPLWGAAPGDDGRYEEHIRLIRKMHANYVHVFPMKMPPRFFAELDKTNMVYGQDIFVWAYEEDFLTESFYQNTMVNIRAAIDHTYQVGRPDRLVLFSVGDELQAASVARTDSRHPEVRNYKGKHLAVTNRTPTEVVLARLIDEAIDYELTRYGRRHLYCHTSWTHIGPIADRPDLEVPRQSALTPDIGDLICMNIYTYARGVRTSPPGSATRTTYQGYIEELAAQTKKPILITQIGLSTSPFEPKSWVPGFGGHKLEEVPKVFSAVWKDVRTAKGKKKFCGLVFFEFQDEWWKSGETPDDSTRLNPEDPEEWFGIYAIGPDNQLIPKGKIADTIRELYSRPQ